MIFLSIYSIFYTFAGVMKQRLLFVCLGNICRSPAAEGIMQYLVDERGLSDQFHIESAAIGPWVVLAMAMTSIAVRNSWTAAISTISTSSSAWTMRI